MYSVKNGTTTLWDVKFTPFTQGFLIIPKLKWASLPQPSARMYSDHPLDIDTADPHQQIPLLESVSSLGPGTAVRDANEVVTVSTHRIPGGGSGEVDP